MLSPLVLLYLFHHCALAHVAGGGRSKTPRKILGGVLHARCVFSGVEGLLWNYIMRGEEASCSGAGVYHLVHVHPRIHAMVIGIRCHPSMALEAPIEAAVDLLALVDQLLGLLGVSQVVVSHLAEVCVGNLLFEIIPLPGTDETALVRNAELVGLIVKHDRISGTDCKA